MDWNLKLRLRRFQEFFSGRQFLWPEHRIRDARDFAAWKEQFAPVYIQRRHANRPRQQYHGEKKRSAHCFREAAPDFKVKKEFKQEIKTENVKFIGKFEK